MKFPVVIFFFPSNHGRPSPKEFSFSRGRPRRSTFSPFTRLQVAPRLRKQGIAMPWRASQVGRMRRCMPPRIPYFYKRRSQPTPYLSTASFQLPRHGKDVEKHHFSSLSQGRKRAKRIADCCYWHGFVARAESRVPGARLTCLASFDRVSQVFDSAVCTCGYL